jgi:hypothetical protein
MYFTYLRYYINYTLYYCALNLCRSARAKADKIKNHWNPNNYSMTYHYNK